MRNFLIKLLGGIPKPPIFRGDEFSANTMNRTIEDIKIQVVNSRDGQVIAVSAWNPDIAVSLYKQVVDYTKTIPEKKQTGIT